MYVMSTPDQETLAAENFCQDNAFPSVQNCPNRSTPNTEFAAYLNMTQTPKAIHLNHDR